MLHLYNSLTRKKEEFQPLDASNIRMYVCGPTVYDRAHLGNARAVVVYDVLYRVLQSLYPKVTYVRNITDVDDKINAAAKANGEPISALTERTLKQFHEDMGALNCLNPTYEPRATNHISDMTAMIEKLIANNHAYESAGHVLYSVKTNTEYGVLSGRKAEEQEAGARVAVEKYKRDAGDFVLWKPADADDDASSIFDSPWGNGRPGWHIECSAMSHTLLGVDFDIHGGGADLKFPHHENEIAQATCAHKGSHYAKYWVHNGFLTVNGEKMSKSLGNFTTVRELLDKGIRGEVIRYALLSTHYSKPLDWSEKLLDDSKKAMDKFYKHALTPTPLPRGEGQVILEALKDDMNTPKAIALLHENPALIPQAAQLLGLFHENPKDWFMKPEVNAEEAAKIQALIDARNDAKANKNFAEADKLRAEIVALGVTIMDRPGGITEWRKD